MRTHSGLRNSWYYIHRSVRGCQGNGQLLGEKNEAEGLSVSYPCWRSLRCDSSRLSRTLNSNGTSASCVLYIVDRLQMTSADFWTVSFSLMWCSINASGPNVCLSWQLSFSPPLQNFLDGLTSAGVVGRSGVTRAFAWRDPVYCHYLGSPQVSFLLTSLSLVCMSLGSTTNSCASERLDTGTL